MVRAIAQRFPGIKIVLLNVGGLEFVEMRGEQYITFSDETASDAAEVLGGATIVPLLHGESTTV